MTIPQAKLGRTGVSVSRLGFGAMELAERGGASERSEVERLLHAVLDAGINLIDTAPDYGDSETLIGEILAGRRDEFFLATKCGCLVDRTPRLLENRKLEHDFRPDNVRAGVEQSLRRLRTDRLDLVQVHSSPQRSEIEAAGTVEEMLRLREEGKLRWLGMSSTLPELEGHLEMGVFDVFQIPYSALEQDHEGVIARAAELGAGTIIRGGVSRGATAPDHDDADHHDYWRAFAAERRAIWEGSGMEAQLRGMPRMEFMLRFVLSNPDIHTTIVGTSKPAHLASNAQVAERGPLAASLVAEAKHRLGAATEGPSA